MAWTVHNSRGEITKKYISEHVNIYIIQIGTELSQVELYRSVGLVPYFILDLKYFIQHCFICRPSDSAVSEDAGIEPRTVATLI